MAFALKCDRCGSYYDWYQRTVGGYGNTVRITILAEDRHDITPSYKSNDLCPACMNTLQSFMIMGHEKEKDDG